MPVRRWSSARGTGLPCLLVVLVTACLDDGRAPQDAEPAGGPDVALVSTGAVDAAIAPDLRAGDDRDASGDTAAPADAGSDADAPTGDGDFDDGTPPFANEMVIVAVSPESGSTQGGTQLLIVGLGFTSDADVLLGGEACLTVDVVDETKIRCITPPNPAGLYDLKVVTATDRASLEEAFRYIAPIGIARVEPDRGPIEGGVPVSVLGSGFTPDTQVSIGGRMLIDPEVVDASELRGFTPSGESGPRVVRASDRAGVASLEAGFTYYRPLRLDGLVPAVGPAAGGAAVVVEGGGFADAAALRVWFGPLEAEVVAVLDDGQLAVTAPPGPADEAVDVTVESADTGVATVVGGFWYYGEVPPFAVLSLWPAWGSTDGGARVVLSGVGLDGVDEVFFDGNTAMILAVGPHHVAVRTPPAVMTGPVDIAVVGDGPSILLPDAFEYRKPLRVDALSPDSGDVAGGDVVALGGDGFVDGVAVRIGPLAAREVEVLGPDSLTLRTPPGSFGPAVVTVTHPDGRRAVAGRPFFYSAEPALHGFSPTRGSLAGGTYVVVRGVGMSPDTEVTFGGVPVPELTWLDPASIAVRTPPWADEQYVEVAIVRGDGVRLPAGDRFLYFDPLSSTGGVWGGAILGTVNVSVVSDVGLPLEGAYVRLDVRGEALYAGLTDDRGQVTLSGPDLSGRQIVSATRPGFSSATVYDVDAENITIELLCAHDGPCGTESDCRSGMLCQDGLCLDPRCAGEPVAPPAVQRGLITGRLSGLDKIGDPAPGEIYLGAVFTTQTGPYQAGSVRTDVENVVLDNGPYTLSSRLGELAVVAICGFWNAETRLFRPVRMGVRRGLFVAADEVYNVDLECRLWLDQALTIKATGAPLVEGGPDVYRHYAFLDFGSEGFFGGLVVHEGTDAVLTAEGFARLEGPLADLRYYVRGGAYTGRSWPYSISFLRDVTALDQPLVLPAFVPVARLVTPDSSAEPPDLIEGYLEWATEGGADPDFWHLRLRDYAGVTWWELVLPGGRRWVNLPQWPEGAETSLFPSGPMLFIPRGVDAIAFEFDNFDNNDFRSANWNAYSLAGFTIANP